MYTLHRQKVWKTAEALLDVPAPSAALELSEVPGLSAVPDERLERAWAVPALKDAAVQERASMAFRLPEALVVTADAAALKQASWVLPQVTELPDAAAEQELAAVTEHAEPGLEVELEPAVESADSGLSAAVRTYFEWAADRIRPERAAVRTRFAGVDRIRFAAVVRTHFAGADRNRLESAADRIRLERVAVRTRFEADRIRPAAVRNDFEPLADHIPGAVRIPADRTRLAAADQTD